jgi:1-aminocyclopropane-1-carboxylate deaminase/D-cysteine desulfhydrase-like pyridoxal-dependent ACC family enzyme
MAVMTAAHPARIRLATLPTPLVAAPRLAQALRAGALYIKRDDLTGFAIGGNKARALEFLIAAAAADRADTLVTGGAPGSNFCAAAAAAALRAGLRCELVLAGQPSRHPGPALALALSWGATVRWTGSAERETVDDQLPRAAAALSSRGHRPYLIPRGGATGLGAIGYALAAFELHNQLGAIGVGTARVVVAVGSGGTLAGLVAGNAALGRPWTLVGASVSRPAVDASVRVLEIARECAHLLAGALTPGHRPGGMVRGADRPVPGAGRPDLAAAQPQPADVAVVDARGPGHGQASLEGRAAAEQAMRTEGLMVDPVYTAKALALVPRYADGGDMVFWHTGGLLDAVADAGAQR